MKVKCLKGTMGGELLKGNVYEVVKKIANWYHIKCEDDVIRSFKCNRFGEIVECQYEP